MKAGNKISINWKHFGCPYDDIEEYIVEEFRHCLGIFVSKACREAGNFRPLCELYTEGPHSETLYISNYGEYTSNKVQGWVDIP